MRKIHEKRALYQLLSKVFRLLFIVSYLMYILHTGNKILTKEK